MEFGVRRCRIGCFIFERDESSSMPLRLWVLGFGAQCVLHIICVCVKYQRRRRRALAFPAEGRGSSNGDDCSLAQFEEERTRYICKEDRIFFWLCFLLIKRR